MRDVPQWHMKYFLYCRKSTEDEERQVLSLQSQRETLDRTFAGRTDIEIVGIFEEAKSAKTPGRPIFAAMLARIEAGEADGIMSWAPDRLARNSIDGGRIIYLLDTGTLRDLKFATYTFENNSQGKFMLSIMFGQSKYYSDALSENVKRGNRTKLENGWRPNRAPLGYINDAATRTIMPDPLRFPLIRRMFELMLSGMASPRDIALTARNDWGFRTPIMKRSGGVPIALSTVYRILGNPFYAGLIQWNDEVYAGAHMPVVTRDEFNHVQALLRRGGQPRPQRHIFPFTGLIRCGNCGMMVTAETRIKPSGRRYTYYHCTRRGLSARCREPSATAQDMREAFAAFLGSLRIAPEVEQWVVREIRTAASNEPTDQQSAYESRAAAAEEIVAQLQELTSLRLRRLVSDEEYVAERSRLLGEQSALESAKARGEAVDRFELFDHMISFSKYAAEWFLDGDERTQRFIAQSVGSNYLLAAKKLSGEAVKPFRTASESDDFRELCGVAEDVRKAEEPRTGALQLYQDLMMSLERPETKKLLENLKEIHRLAGVEVVSLAPRTSGGTAQGGATPSRAPRSDRGSRHTQWHISG